MTKLRNVSRAIRYVESDGQKVAIAPGGELEVDGRVKWEDHLFVKTGSLELIKPAPTKRKSKPKDEPVAEAPVEEGSPDSE